MIDIKLVKSGNGYERTDGTAIYDISTDNKTVGEFIDELLRTRPYEWGWFGIRNSDFTSTSVGVPYYKAKCEYYKGKIISKPLSQKYLLSRFTEVDGSGGYNCSNFDFTINETKI